MSGTVVELQARPRRGYAPRSPSQEDRGIDWGRRGADQLRAGARGSGARAPRAGGAARSSLAAAGARRAAGADARGAGCGARPGASRSPTGQTPPAERGLGHPRRRRSCGSWDPRPRLRPALARPVLRHDAAREAGGAIRAASPAKRSRRVTPKTKPKSTKPQRAAKPKTRQNERPAAKTPTNRRASKPAPPPKPRTLTRAQRAVSWRRYPTAAYYEVYLRRGAKTLYETKTLRPSAMLPAHLTLRPGTYHVVVHPAIPSDAGIILGSAIYQ